MPVSIQSITFNSTQFSEGDTTPRDVTVTPNTYFIKVNLELDSGLNLEANPESGIEASTYGESPDTGDIQIIFWLDEGSDSEEAPERAIVLECPKMNSTMISVKRRTSPDVTLFQQIWDAPEPLNPNDMGTVINDHKPISRRVIYNIPHNPRPL